MRHRKRKAPIFLNLKQVKALFCWSGDLLAAARAAGYGNPKAAVNRLMKNRVFTHNLQRKQESMAEESGRLLGKQLTVCRAEVINRLWELAQLPPTETNNTIGGQIKAAETLALVFDIKVNRPADLDRELQGKTSAEIDFFVEHGYFPDPPDPLDSTDPQADSGSSIAAQPSEREPNE